MEMKDMSLEQIEAYNASQDPYMKAMLGQLLICFVNRNKGTVRMPVKEVDGTGGYLLTMELDAHKGEFIFRTEKKQ